MNYGKITRFNRKRIEIKNKNLISNNQSSNKDTTKMEGQKIKFIDLFCGIGGFHQALSENDSERVFASDADKNAGHFVVIKLQDMTQQK